MTHESEQEYSPSHKPMGIDVDVTARGNLVPHARVIHKPERAIILPRHIVVKPGRDSEGELPTPRERHMLTVRRPRVVKYSTSRVDPTSSTSLDGQLMDLSEHFNMLCCCP